MNKLFEFLKHQLEVAVVTGFIVIAFVIDGMMMTNHTYFEIGIVGILASVFAMVLVVIFKITGKSWKGVGKLLLLYVAAAGITTLYMQMETQNLSIQKTQAAITTIGWAIAIWLAATFLLSVVYAFYRATVPPVLWYNSDENLHPIVRRVISFILLIVIMMIALLFKERWWMFIGAVIVVVVAWFLGRSQVPKVPEPPLGMVDDEEDADTERVEPEGEGTPDAIITGTGGITFLMPLTTSAPDSDIPDPTKVTNIPAVTIVTPVSIPVVIEDDLPTSPPAAAPAPVKLKKLPERGPDGRFIKKSDTTK